MRFRKAAGKKKAVVTLTENEIVEACYNFVRERKIEPGRISYLKIPIRDKVDSAGRKRRRGIEFQVEIEKS